MRAALFHCVVSLALVTCKGAVPPPVSPSPSAASCETASAEIAQLVAADQAARQEPPTPAEWPKIRVADLQRRMRVSELFTAGCLSTPTDFGSAALLYQHGGVPEDYKQAFQFASRAVVLGDPSMKDRMALAVDRYLVSTKHRQLFASQFHRRDDEPCWCLHPVEPTFPDGARVESTGKSLEEQRERVRTMNASTSGCTRIECEEQMLSTPRGSVAGVW